MDSAVPTSGSHTFDQTTTHPPHRSQRPAHRVRFPLAVILAALTLALASCGGDEPDGGSEKSDATTTVESLEASIGTDRAVTYSDGLKVQVTGVERYTPTSSAAGTKPGNVSVKATVKITNATSSPIDVELADVTMTARGEAVDEIFDEAGGIAHFTGSLAKGKTATGVYGFSVPADATGSMTVEVTPDLRHDAASFTGGL